MSRICPINHSVVLYLDCLDCDDKICMNHNKSPQNVKYDPREVYHKNVKKQNEKYKKR